MQFDYGRFLGNVLCFIANQIRMAVLYTERLMISVRNKHTFAIAFLLMKNIWFIWSDLSLFLSYCDKNSGQKNKSPLHLGILLWLAHAQVPLIETIPTSVWLVLYDIKTSMFGVNLDSNVYQRAHSHLETIAAIRFYWNIFSLNMSCHFHYKKRFFHWNIFIQFQWNEKKNEAFSFGNRQKKTIPWLHNYFVWPVAWANH